MVEYNGDGGWIQHFESIEAATVAGCHEAAKAHGITTEQADLCDDGNNGCPTCPEVPMGYVLKDGRYQLQQSSEVK